MAWSIDARIPIRLLPDSAALAAARAEGRPAAVLAEAGADAPADAARFAPGGPARHASACPCCQGRSPAALALDALFQARTRGSRAWFDRVLVLAQGAGAEEVAAALRDDALTAARFRPG